MKQFILATVFLFSVSFLLQASDTESAVNTSRQAEFVKQRKALFNEKMESIRDVAFEAAKVHKILSETKRLDAIEVHRKLREIELDHEMTKKLQLLEERLSDMARIFIDILQLIDMARLIE